MILIVESGATKTDWCVVRSDGTTLEVKTAGMNLAVMPPAEVRKIIMEAVSLLAQADPSFCGERDIEEIHFYAAGLICVPGEKVPSIARNLDAVLGEVFPGAGSVEYASDLLDAARAVCGHGKGIAAILGTGSNSCFYDGTDIVRNVRSAGFILGDEGGGACLGKLFMADFLKGLVPGDIAEEFGRDFKVDYMTVVQNVYRSPAPSKYLGSFAPWILERYHRSGYVRELVEQNFSSFIQRCLMQYDFRNYPVGVVGGFGYANREILLRVGAQYGITFGTIIPAPMEGLVRYHTSL